MAVFDEIAAANEGYAAGFRKGDLAAAPGRKLAVIACMDARLDPAKALGLADGDAHVIRNAGGRASDDAIRSLVISQMLLGTDAVVVLHHTECGMLTFSNDDLRRRVQDAFGVDASGIDFLPFTDTEQSVRDDVQAIRDNPMIPDSVSVRGYVYDVKTGRIHEVASA